VKVDSVDRVASGVNRCNTLKLNLVKIRKNPKGFQSKHLSLIKFIISK
jgi:hypothetical protein